MKKKTIKAWVVKSKDTSWRNLYRDCIFSKKKMAEYVADIENNEVFEVQIIINK